jgi:hypothetical protein
MVITVEITVTAPAQSSAMDVVYGGKPIVVFVGSCLGGSMITQGGSQSAAGFVSFQISGPT